MLNSALFLWIPPVTRKCPTVCPPTELSSGFVLKQHLALARKSSLPEHYFHGLVSAHPLQLGFQIASRHILHPRTLRLHNRELRTRIIFPCSTT